MNLARHGTSRMENRKFHVERNDGPAFDYFKLIKEVKRLGEAKANLERKVRFAFLADCATQHLSMLVQVVGAQRGLDIQVREAEYDTIEREVFNPSSALYAFDPDFIVIVKSTEKLKTKFYGAPHREAADDVVKHLSSIWTAIKSHSRATIIQSTFVLPLERPFGNFGRKLPTALDQFFADVNNKLAECAREERQVLLNDVDHLAATVGRRNWIDEKMWALAKEPCALEYMPMLAHNIVDLASSRKH
jgi:predicted enzyme involved in methoxymalonyl-ACP biosynthesis